MKEKLIAYSIVVGIILAVVFSYGSYQLLASGKALAITRPQIILSADCPWASMPPSIREYISATATNITKLNRVDMLELSAWYAEMAKKYREPVTLLGNKGYPMLKRDTEPLEYKVIEGERWVKIKKEVAK